MDTYMKRLLLFAGALLWCGHIMAGIGVTMPADSARAQMQIKQVSKSSDITNPTSADKKPAFKSIEKETPKIDKSDISLGNAEIKKKITAEEMKSLAKKENTNAVKKDAIPAVSYPFYPGGNIAIREFVRQNQQYPPECKRERLRGRVEVMIAIAPDGTPHSATISKSSGNIHMDAEALRIAELMPKWQPAPESKDPQAIDYIIFVNFRPGR